MKENKTEPAATDFTRRDFIKTAGVGIIGAPYIAKTAWAQTPPSDLIRHAVIGTGSMGRNHTKIFGNTKGCDLVAICDVDPEQIGKALKTFPNSEKVKTYSDYRELLKDKSIASIASAAPDHWHSPLALWAMMAGKHG